MTQQNRPPEPQGEDWQTWGRRLMTYLSQTRIPLVQQTGNEPATDDGLLMWDRTKKYVVVSLDNQFRQVATKQAVPPANTGSTGDVTGMVSWDTNYIYVCVANYDGSTAIWKRVALATW